MSGIIAKDRILNRVNCNDGTDQAGRREEEAAEERQYDQTVEGGRQGGEGCRGGLQYQEVAPREISNERHEEAEGPQ